MPSPPSIRRRVHSEKRARGRIHIHTEFPATLADNVDVRAKWTHMLLLLPASERERETRSVQAGRCPSSPPSQIFSTRTRHTHTRRTDIFARALTFFWQPSPTPFDMAMSMSCVAISRAAARRAQLCYRLWASGYYILFRF